MFEEYFNVWRNTTGHVPRGVKSSANMGGGEEGWTIYVPISTEGSGTPSTRPKTAFDNVYVPTRGQLIASKQTVGAQALFSCYFGGGRRQYTGRAVYRRDVIMEFDCI